MKVLTNNGIVDLEDFDEDDFSVAGVARALSKLKRCAGNFEYPMSVAQHAVIVSQTVKQMGGTLEEQLAGLHHDDSEFLTGDLNGVIKPYCGDFMEIEDAIMDVVDAMYGIDTRCKVVREADKQVGLAELDFHSALTHACPRIMSNVRHRTLTYNLMAMTPWSESEALAKYLDRHAELMLALKVEADKPTPKLEGVLN